MNKIRFIMEVQTLFKALLEAKSFKGALSLITVYLVEFFLPLTGFLLAGFSLVVFEGVLKGFVNLKEGRSLTANGWEVIGKMMLYMGILIMGGSRS